MAGSDATDGRQVSHNFKIKVGVRFRPARSAARGGRVILPLHQRLKLMKAGEKLTHDEFAGIAVAQVDKLVGSNLAPETIQALLDAEQLLHVAKRAELDARDPLSRTWQDIDTDVESLGLVEKEREQSLQQALQHAGFDPRKKKAKADEKENEHAWDHVKSSGARLLKVEQGSVSMFVPGAGVRPFHFASVFDGAARQREVYDGLAREAVLTALNGFNSCLLCYGQTGSGKTFTAFGPTGIFDEVGSRHHLDKNAVPEAAGVALRAFSEIFQVSQNALVREEIRVGVSVQYVEIYGAQITDLVSGEDVRLFHSAAGAGDATLQCRLAGARSTKVESLSDVVAILQAGEARKKYAATAMNERSSRAHTVMVLSIAQRHLQTDALTHSTLHLCDLAGSEQVKKSKVVGQQLKEAVAINKSLSALGKCIKALVEDHKHVPFMESKLTTLLRNALGGNCATVAIVSASSEPHNADETLQAMRFGESISTITNHAKIAAQSSASALGQIDAALRQCTEGLASLELRGKQHLPSYAKLCERMKQMEMTRAELCAL